MTPTMPLSPFRSRLILLLIVVMFFGSFGTAAYLRFTGWTPGHGKNRGELLQPPKDLSALTLLRADGQPYIWMPEKNTWHIVVAPSLDCVDACTKAFDALYRLWLSEGRKAQRLEVLWFGALPANAPRFRNLIQMRPNTQLTTALSEIARVEAVPVYLVDPSGFLVLHYPGAHFDPADLRQDLNKLLK